MDYQHLYAYLNTRPLEELQDCMRNIVRLTRKRTCHDQKLEGDKISTEEDVILTANKIPKILQENRVAQRVWIEEAVLSHFTSKLQLPAERDKTLSTLLLSPKVCKYLMNVNAKIEEDQRKLSKVVPTPHVPTHDNLMDVEIAKGDEVFTTKPTKRARTSEIYANEQSACSSNIIKSDSGGADTPVSSSTMSAGPLADPRQSTNVPGKEPFLWTETMDATLRDVVEHGEGWDAAAKAVGHGMTSQQCRKRWSTSVGPTQKGLKLGTVDWSADEERRLGELIAQHPLQPAWNKTLQCMFDRIDWQTIGTILGRAPASCADKWKSLQHSKMKKGAFSLTEDAYIERRVKEWGDKGLGLWVQLEKEMNRGDSSIQARWARLHARGSDP